MATTLLRLTATVVLEETGSARLALATKHFPVLHGQHA